MSSEVSVIGHLLSPSPVVGKAKSLLITMGGIDEGPDEKYNRNLEEIGDVGSKLVRLPFRGKSYLLRFYYQRDGGTGLDIVRGGTPKSRRALKVYLRRSLSLRPRKLEKY